jgi:hypothetical protein
LKLNSSQRFSHITTALRSHRSSIATACSGFDETVEANICSAEPDITVAFPQMGASYELDRSP